MDTIQDYEAENGFANASCLLVRLYSNYSASSEFAQMSPYERAEVAKEFQALYDLLLVISGFNLRNTEEVTVSLPDQLGSTRSSIVHGNPNRQLTQATT